MMERDYYYLWQKVADRTAMGLPKFREREVNPIIWDIASNLIERPIFQIELWKEYFYRVLIQETFDDYIIDVEHHIIALKGYSVQTCGDHLLLNKNGLQGLIKLKALDFPTTMYGMEIVIPCEYDRIFDSLDEIGLIRATKNSGWGIINEFNNVVVPFEYNHLSPIYPQKDGRYKVIAQKNAGEPEFNLFINKEYTLQEGDNDVPILKRPPLFIKGQ